MDRYGLLCHPYHLNERRTVRYFDTHTHVVSPDVERYPRSSLSGRESQWSQDQATPVDELVRQMDQAGIEYALVVQPLNTYGYDNRYAAESVAQYPGRLFGVCSVDFASDGAVSEISRLLDAGSYVGCRLYRGGRKAPLHAGPLDDPRTFDAWRIVEERLLPVAIRMEVESIPQ